METLEFFALKVIRAASPEEYALFVRESRLLQTMPEDAGVVRMIDWIEFPNDLAIYILLEMADCDLEALFKKLRRELLRCAIRVGRDLRSRGAGIQLMFIGQRFQSSAITPGGWDFFSLSCKGQPDNLARS